MKKQTNIYDILEHLEKRKALYLGNHYNFDSLDSFVSGFTIAASPRQLKHERYQDFPLFSIWLLGHIKRHFGQSGGWHWQIRNRNLRNDEKAFKDFFELLNKFKKTKIRKKELVLDNDAIKYCKENSKRFRIIDGKQIPISINPISVIQTSFSDSTTVMIDYIDKNGKEVDWFWEISEEKIKDRLLSDFGHLKSKWKKM